MTELMVIFVIALLVLGPKRLPGVARSLGKGLAEFRRASTDMRREFLDVAEEVRIDPHSFAAEADEAPNGERARDRHSGEAGPGDAEPETEAGAGTEAASADADPGSRPQPTGKRGDD